MSRKKKCGYAQYGDGHSVTAAPDFFILHINIIKWNQRFPAGFTKFFEDAVITNDSAQTIDESKKSEHRNSK